MRNANRNSLLMEIAIVILFFSLTCGTFLRLFTQNFESNRDSRIQTQAVIEVQGLCEALKASRDMDKTLDSRGFSMENGQWLLDMKEYMVTASIETEQGAAGRLQTATLLAKNADIVYAECTASGYTPTEAES